MSKDSSDIWHPAIDELHSWLKKNLPIPISDPITTKVTRENFQEGCVDITFTFKADAVAHWFLSSTPPDRAAVQVDVQNKKQNPVDAKKEANAVQYGGSHYKIQKIQAWDFISANNIGFFEGNAIKYLSRWKDKGGIEDLRKAKHYIEKLIEIETKEKQ